MKRFLLFTLMALATTSLCAQRSDKVSSDRLLFEMLSQPSTTQNWHPELVVTDSLLKPTRERGIYLVEGQHFQIASLSSSFYVRKSADGQWEVLNDGAYPLETMANLLLNRIESNSHQLLLHHHLYGGKVPRIMMPMQNFFDVLMRNMDAYCSITAIDASQIDAVLVLHHPRQNFIHMLRLKLPTRKLMTADSTIEGDLYTNIPQRNVKALFSEKQQTK